MQHSSAWGIVSILSPAQFFCQKQFLYIFGNLRVFGNFSGMSTIFFWFLYNLQTRTKGIIKPFFLDLYSSGQDTMLKFCTLTNTLKGYRSKKKFQDGSYYVYFTYQNTTLRFWSVKYAILIMFNFF